MEDRYLVLGGIFRIICPRVLAPSYVVQGGIGKKIDNVLGGYLIIVPGGERSLSICPRE